MLDSVVELGCVSRFEQMVFVVMGATLSSKFQYHKFPKELVGEAVRMYFRYNLSFRDIAEIYLNRGIEISHEIIRLWTKRYGHKYASEITKRMTLNTTQYHIDEVFLKINGDTYYAFRAGDEEGTELETLVQKRRNKKAAKRFFKKVLSRYEYIPGKVIVTDKLKSYPAALKELGPHKKHVSHKAANMRAESSHRHLRKREKGLQRFKSHRHAQMFLTSYTKIRNHFCPRQHLLFADEYRETMVKRFDIWNIITNKIIAA